MTDSVDQFREQPKDKLFAALVGAQKSVEAVHKRSLNKFHGYSYASAEDIIAEARDALNENGLAFSATGSTLHKQEGALTLSVDYVLAHASGQHACFHGCVPVIPDKGRPEDKAVFAAMTEGLAYQLRGLLLIERTNESTPSARDDRGYAPPVRRNAVPVAAAAPSQESDDDRAARLLKAITSAIDEAAIQAAAKEAAGLPKSFTSTLATAAAKRRGELAPKELAK